MIKIFKNEYENKTKNIQSANNATERSFISRLSRFAQAISITCDYKKNVYNNVKISEHNGRNFLT